MVVRSRRTRAALAAVLALACFPFSLGTPAAADVVAVKGSAYGFFTNVSLFGGPSSTHGPSPTVTLPADGSATPITQSLPEGGRGQYGPAIVFGGIWPDDAPTGGPSGPITVSTQGTKGAGGTVTSSVSIVLHNPPRPMAPGGIGPGPLIAEDVRSTCTANESGVSGSVRFLNGKVETKYDQNTQLPIQSAIRQIPQNPPVNQEYTGTIDHVGDHFRIVLNEQIRNADGSLTVNAAHMFLLGPIAVGEMIVGQTVCGATAGPSSSTPGPTSPQPTSPQPTSPNPGSPSPTSPAAAPTTEAPSPTSTVATTDSTEVPPSSTSSSVPVPGTSAGGASTPSAGGSKNLAAAQAGDGGGGSGLALVLGAGTLGIGGAAAGVWFRRRRLGGQELDSLIR